MCLTLVYSNVINKKTFSIIELFNVFFKFISGQKSLVNYKFFVHTKTLWDILFWNWILLNILNFVTCTKLIKVCDNGIPLNGFEYGTRFQCIPNVQFSFSEPLTKCLTRYWRIRLLKWVDHKAGDRKLERNKCRFKCL